MSKSKFLVVILFLLMLIPVMKLEASEHNVLFLGDISFGENYMTLEGVNTLKGDRRYILPLKNFRRILNNAELVIGNLETPVTKNFSDPVSGKAYVHWTDPDKAPDALFESNIKALSLANNHTLDYGIRGLKDTFENLEKAGLYFFGAGMDSQEAMEPFHFRIKMGKEWIDWFVIAGFEYYKNYDRYDFYSDSQTPGVNQLDIEAVTKEIGKIKSDHPESRVIIYPHWGGNYRWRTRQQQRMARKLIDGGADLIIGHGAHMMQEIEYYRGKWIVYSLGNFVFNSQGRYERYGVDPFSLIASLEPTDGENGRGWKIKLYPIFTDNRITLYQGFFLEKKDFDKALGILEEKDSSGSLKAKALSGRDRFGYFMELHVN